MIVKIDLNNKRYGGRIYENQFINLLSDAYKFKRVYLMRHPIKLLNIPWILWVYIKYHFFYKGTVILTNHTTWIAGRRSKNLVVVHHIDTSTSKGLSGLFQKICDKALLHYKSRFKITVTVASFWKKQLEDYGFANTHLIYNSFDPSLYSFTQEEIDDFKNHYDLKGKPIIYLGNCQKQKGVVEAFNSLKSIDAHFVTSGIKDVEIAARHLNLNFRDYRLLLAASNLVVTMSSLTEGWNRTAHEAMLCGTPVIGSATGGMLELFEIGGGITCRDFSNLKNLTLGILTRDEKIDAPQLRRFDLNYFKEKWSEVLTTLLKQ